MSTSTFNRKDSRQLVYNAGLKLGYASTADSITKSPPSIQDAFQIQNSNWGSDELRGRLTYRPNQPTDDRVKPTGLITDDSIALTGSDYLDNSDLEYEILGGIHPDELNEAIRLAPRETYFTNRVPLSIWDDNDQSAADVLSWSIASLTATRAKGTTYVRDGFQALEVTTSAANGYVQGASKRCQPGEKFYHAAHVLCPNGATAQYQLYDVTHGTVIRTISAVAGNWLHFSAVDEIPSGCYQIAVRLGATASGALTVWGALPCHNLSDKTPLGPSWLSERWQMLELANGIYDRRVSENIDTASSRRYEPLLDSDYDYEVAPPEENPSRWFFNSEEDLPSNDLWIYGSRPHSDRAAMDDEDDEIEINEEYWRAAVLHQVALIMMNRDKDPTWLALEEKTNTTLLAQRQVRKPTSKPERYTVHHSGGRL